jgi:phage-related minor tail protein
MYNTKNLDARISAPAKADLTKGLQLMSKLRAMSSTARRLYGLLRTIMDNKEIEVPVPASDSEESIKSRDNSIDSTTIPSRVSDVGRGGNSMRSNSGHSHPQQQQQQGIIQHPPSTPRSGTAQQQQQHAITQSPKEQHYPIRHFQQSLADVIAAPNMASHPNIDGSGKRIKVHFCSYITLFFY